MMHCQCTVNFKACLTKDYFQAQTLFFKTGARYNHKIERSNHIVREILMNILPSFN